MSDFSHQLELLQSNRHSAEARALYTTLAGYIHRRVEHMRIQRYPDLLSQARAEELVAEILYQLMSGGLARFHGDSLPQLLGYVRTISDRTVWRAARRTREERDALDGPAGEAVRSWSRPTRPPDEAVRMVQHTKMREADRRYLEQLLRHGSKAELARQLGVSRAAVTQRVHRIQERIASLSRGEQEAVRSWLEVAAHRALNRAEVAQPR